MPCQTITSLSSSWTNTTGTRTQTLTLNGTALTVNQTTSTTFGNGNVATLTSTITGSGSLTKAGTGTLTLSSANTYTGTTTIANGIIRLAGGDDRLPTGTVVSIGQAGGTTVGTLDLNGQNQTIAGLNSNTGTNTVAGDRNTVTSATASTLTINGSGTYVFGNNTTQNSGTITGAVAVTKSGTGTQTFGSNVDYSGSTTVNGGTLVFNASKSGLNDNVVNNGGTLAGTGTIFGATTVNAGGTIRGGDPTGNGTGTLNLGTVLTVKGAASNGGAVASQLAVDGNGAITGNSKIFAGANDFVLDATNGKVVIRLLNDSGLTHSGMYSIVLATGNTGKFRNATQAVSAGNSFNAADFEVIGSWAAYNETALKVEAIDVTTDRLVLDFQPVPEPATVLAIGAAGLGLVSWVRRKRKAKAETAATA